MEDFGINDRKIKMIHKDGGCEGMVGACGTHGRDEMHTFCQKHEIKRLLQRPRHKW